MKRDATEQAALWFLRLREAGADTALRTRFEAWRDASPEHDREFRAIVGLWDGFDDLAASRRLDAAVTHVRRRRGLRAAGVAGLFAVLAAGVFAWWQAMPRGEVAVIVLEAPRGATREHVLVDGSRVLLGAGSAVEVAFSHGARDVRLLAGEARFEVSSDASRVFSVTAGDARVRVTGTRFVVARHAHDTAVTVLEGRVAVASVVPGGELALVAGDAVDVDDGAAPRRVTRPVAEAEAFVEARLVFRQASLEDVALALSRYRDKPVLAAPGGPRIDAVVQAARVEDVLRVLPGIAPVRVVEEDAATRLVPR
ncbi:FecR family protein [Dokdonella sp. MW10]|uniref:FecR family protein n=1 Tax=Dokdonella sp. MW10 TaxID=2992926 RepID=UPI003F7DB8D1